MARLLDGSLYMVPSQPGNNAGYTAVEVVIVLAIAGVLCGMGWPKVADWIERAELTAATRALIAEIRHAQQDARTTGRRIRIVIDPADGSVTSVFPDGTERVHRLAASLTFGFPDNPTSDGVTFRENTIWISPRPGPQASVGAVGIRGRSAAARKVTLSLTGHPSETAWDGVRWQ